MGHTVDLRHDGYRTPLLEYMPGIPMPKPATYPSNRMWQAIMGSSNTVGVAQWSKGAYSVNASQLQDDVAIIRSKVGTNPSFRGTFQNTNVYTKPTTGSCASIPAALTATGFHTPDSEHRYLVRTLSNTTASQVQMFGTVSFDPNVRVQISYEPVALRNGTWVTTGSRVLCTRPDIYGDDAARRENVCTRTLAGTFRVIFRNIGLSRSETNPAPAANSPEFPSYGSLGRMTARFCFV